MPAQPATPRLCDKHAECALANTMASSNALRVLRAFHCETGGTRCERARRIAAGQPVPPDLLPDGRRLADTGVRIDGLG